MAVITRTIGTASRHYSTIAAWEADLDNGAIYSSGDDAVGECYNDSAFDEAVTFNGGGTVGLASVTLSVAAGERHDGTAGTGARIVRSAAAGVTLNISRSNFVIEWLELDRASNADTGTTTGIQINTPTPIIRNMIIHGIRSTDGNCYGIVDTNDNYVALNNIVYEVFNEATGSAPCVGIAETGGTARNYTAQNNTVHRVRNDNGTGVANGMQFQGGTLTIRNNLVTGTTGTTSGSIADFLVTTQSYNASSDATASGTGSLTNLVTADQYVSTTIGAEDLHLKSGADAIDAGLDLGTSNGVNIDINGRDRDAEGDTWDIGAHEFVAAGGGGSEDALTASDLDAASALLSTPALGQEHGLSATDLLGAASTLTTPSLNESHLLAADDVDSGAPTLSMPAIGQVHAFTSADLNGAAALLGAPAIGQVHVLTVSDLNAAAVVLSSPILLEDGNLLADDLLSGVPLLGTPASGQIHILSANDLTSTAPILDTSALNAPDVAPGRSGISVGMGMGLGGFTGGV